MSATHVRVMELNQAPTWMNRNRNLTSKGYDL
jgi:hypothetical protein